MPNATSISNPPDQPTLPAEHLWDIHDLARFLKRSENTVRKVVRSTDAPTPVYTDGAGSLWDPRSWWVWAEQQTVATTRAEATKTRRAARVGVAGGKATRV